MMNTAVAERTSNLSLSVTYNVALGAGRLKQTKKSTFIEATNAAQFCSMLKTGIYRSLCEQGIISDHTLMQLMQMQRGGTSCQ